MTHQSPTGGKGFTYFAPAGRALRDEVDAMAARVAESPLLQVIFEAIDSYVLVLNKERQVLAANVSVEEALGVNSIECIIGQRPGEVFGCPHHLKGPDGCGTSPVCEMCGAVLAILESQETGAAATRDCILSVQRGGSRESREYRVRACPLELAGDSLTLVVMRDISAEKRKDVLERVFLEDLSVSLGAIMGWSELLKLSHEPPEAVQEIMHLIEMMSFEVNTHRLMLLAEREELGVNERELKVSEVMTSVERIFHAHPAAAGKTLEITAPVEDAPIFSDLALLRRVLTSMVINALEATGRGGRVRLWFERRKNRPGFFVHNTGVMDPQVAARVFDRSFTTKEEKGRGLGGYSMQLFGQKYLGGEVGFESSEGAGTTFFILLPAKAP